MIHAIESGEDGNEWLIENISRNELSPELLAKFDAAVAARAAKEEEEEAAATE